MTSQAVIYCRVSTQKQKANGHGLESQEHRCREYAKSNGYRVVAVFKDDFSGGGDFLNRPAMRELLDYLDEHPQVDFTVIFDDLKRFSRDTEFHWKLRKALKARSAEPKCLNFSFEDTPEGEFIETVIASMGQLERQQNRRQVIQKQKARLEKGYWTFQPPVGYDYISDPQHGKLISPKNPDAEAVRQALLGFAHGSFQSMKEIQQFLSQKLRRKINKDTPRFILNNILYAGMVEYPRWSIARCQGHHTGIITIDVYEKIQTRLNEKSRGFVRKDNREEFPLRGFVRCECCKKPLTASWSTGRSKKYPYYRCGTPGCIGSIKKSALEEKFVNVLKRVAPRQGLIQLLEAVVQNELETSQANANQHKATIERRIQHLDSEKSKALGFALNAKSESVRVAYEDKVQSLDEEVQTLTSELNQKHLQKKVGTVSLRGRDLLKNPSTAWLNGDLKVRQTIQKLVFKSPLLVQENLELGTAENTLLFRVFSEFSGDDNTLVELVRESWHQIEEYFYIN